MKDADLTAAQWRLLARLQEHGFFVRGSNRRVANVLAEKGLVRLSFWAYAKTPEAEITADGRRLLGGQS